MSDPALRPGDDPRPGDDRWPGDDRRFEDAVADLRAKVGTVGVWARRHDLDAGLARGIEELGYGTVWVGSSPPADLAVVRELLGATEWVTVATGIVDIWTADPVAVARSTVGVLGEHPGRFLLGVGVGHPEAAGERAARPYDALVRYLEVLADEGVPSDGVVLAALGPRVLRLAAQRTAGAHPYLVTPEHTRSAREVLGDGRLLAPEQHVLLEPSPATARTTAREAIGSSYLQMRNYRANLLRLGYTEGDLDDGGSDTLIDDVVAWGPADAVAARVRAHLDAGADHVAVRVVPSGRAMFEDLATLGEALGLVGQNVAHDE